jgi:hypothetical protein
VGSQPGAKQRGVPPGAPSSGAGSKAPRVGPQTAWVLRARRRGWWGRGGRRRRVGASRRRRNGRVAPYLTARLAGRARGQGGRQNVGNFPAHPTSLFSPESERGEPRHVGCSAPSTASARPHALFRGFSYKNFAGTGPISQLRVVLLQNPCGGTKCACFRACARVCRGGSLGHF